MTFRDIVNQVLDKSKDPTVPTEKQMIWLHKMLHEIDENNVLTCCRKE